MPYKLLRLLLAALFSMAAKLAWQHRSLVAEAPSRLAQSLREGKGDQRSAQALRGPRRRQSRTVHFSPSVSPPPSFPAWAPNDTYVIRPEWIFCASYTQTALVPQPSLVGGGSIAHAAYVAAVPSHHGINKRVRGEPKHWFANRVSPSHQNPPRPTRRASANWG